MNRQDAKDAKKTESRVRDAFALAPWICLLGVLGVLAVHSGGVSRSSGDAAGPAKPAYIGAPSCAAAGCHNGNDLGHPLGSEYSIWSARDPHARAFAVLSGERSQKIMKAYGGGDAACLACHALPSDGEAAAPSADLLADGVSCEACHGPASLWRDTHYTDEWRRLSADEKEKRGFFPTRDLAQRTAMCARCHVGRPGAEVNHDLIAAGHPRLTFEYTSYHDLLPRHWDRERLPRTGGEDKEEEYGADFTARAWEIGQITSLAASHKPVETEFADLDCFACHHDLGHTDWRQKRPAVEKRGLPVPAARWYTTGKEFLADGGLDPAVKPSDDLADWANRLQEAAVEAGRAHKTVKQEEIKALLLRVTKPDADDDGPPDWDHAAQTYLAAAALSRALAEMDRAAAPPPPEVVRCLRNTLAFPPANDSPRDFSPIKFRDALRDFRAAFKN